MRLFEITSPYEVKPDKKEIDKPLRFGYGSPGQENQAPTRVSGNAEYAKRFDSIVAPILLQNCKEIISLYKNSNRLIYRGVKRQSAKDDFIAGIRTDREPTELSDTMTKIASDVIIEFGGTATRTNSIFCSTRDVTASDWGSSFIVFPKDGWSVTYYTNLSGYAFGFLYSIGHKATRDSEAVEMVRDSYKRHKISFDKSNLLSSPRFELMIAGDSWIGINTSHMKLIQNWLKTCKL